ncbi:hypothetical protein [Caudoviricetes sp.]|nr:hypothetical protein [Caudoviricetes sp.]
MSEFNSTKTRFHTFCESSYLLTGNYPTDQELISKFELTLAELEDLKIGCRTILSNRGLPPLQETLWEDEFDPQFVLACNLMSATADKRATPTKLKEAGLTSIQWQGFLRREKYRAYYENLIKDSFSTVLLSAKTSLARNVEAGDLASIKHLHEMTGTYRPNQETQVNLGLVIAQIMELFARHVEPKVLELVAEDLGRIITIQPKELSA